MSFDIFFMTCRFAADKTEVLDPATGKTRTILPSDPLDADELSAVRKLLEENRASGQVGEDCIDLHFADGGNAEVYCSGLEDGCMLALRGLTPDVVKFLFALLKAGNWVMIPTMENTVAIATSRECLKNIPHDFLAIVVCESAEQIWHRLNGGFRAWKKYRDQIVGDFGPNGPTQ